MAKIRNPTTFSEYYNIPSDELDRIGVLNPTLAIDTKLFIDPLLFKKSCHDEIKNDAARQYREHFTMIIELLIVSRKYNDVAWRSARRLFQFHEIRGTCLGYGTASIFGSGFGSNLIDIVMSTAKEIVDLGINDPDLFVAMALFEENIGPDRISDMTTNVIIDALLKFNNRVISGLSIPTKSFQVSSKHCNLPLNPFYSKRTPVILLPKDILRQLPIALDWDGVSDAAYHNVVFRSRVNEHIAHIWEAKSRRDKKTLKIQAMSGEESFQTLLDIIHNVRADPYDLNNDPSGKLKWTEAAKQFTKTYPLTLIKPKILDINSVYKIVLLIISQFRKLIESNGLWKNLWYGNKPLSEKYSQRLFFAASFFYCKANNLDISPEVDSGTGQVDFKFSTGFSSRVLVEVKLSKNSKLISGYEKQLETYKRAEDTIRAIYLVIDIGGMGKKDEKLLKIRAIAKNKGDSVSDIEFIDGKPQQSASNR